MRTGFLFATMMVSGLVTADVKLPNVFSDHMVLQRESRVKVWGTADAGEAVKVLGSWGRAVSTRAGSDGRWSVDLTTGAAGGPYTLTVQGTNEISIKDVLLGEVWVCSGQSNMWWPLGPATNRTQVENALGEVVRADWPMIRFLTVPQKNENQPMADQGGRWQVCSPATAGNFSAVGYFFGRELYQKLNVPIGLISTTVGGTRIELWTSKEKSEEIRKDWKGEAPANATLFNGMVNPLIPFGIRGAIWYQGESNVGNASEYLELFSGMVEDWRSRWGRGDFPFYSVQIAPFSGYQGGASALLREAQLESLKVKNTGLAVTTDITPNVADIHPSVKFEVGERLSRWALDRVYGRPTVVSGPLYQSLSRVGGKLRLSFDYGQGLKLVGGAGAFEVAGEDRVFYPAEVEVDGRTLVVWSPSVKVPVAVRHGWNDTPKAALFNSAGLPASPFRTDRWGNP